MSTYGRQPTTTEYRHPASSAASPADGVLIPFGGPRQHPVYPSAPSPEADANPLLARINPGHRSRLKALACELVWATTWADDANQRIAPRLGLPQLAVVTWPEASAAEEEQDERQGERVFNCREFPA
jgi:hypothetical protein